MNVKDFKRLQKQSAKAAALLKALGHPERLLILCQLVDAEVSVGELLARSKLSQSALSQHLARLRQQKLVKTRKQAQTVYYSLANEQVAQVLELLHRLYCQ